MSLYLKNEDIKFRTIPIPREISHSCGLAIKFDLNDIDFAKNIVQKKQYWYRGNV